MLQYRNNKNMFSLCQILYSVINNLANCMFRNLYIALWTKDYMGKKYLKMFLVA